MEGLDVVLECMVEIMEDYLSGTNVAASYTIRDSLLADFDDELDGTDFEELFPPNDDLVRANIAIQTERFALTCRGGQLIVVESCGMCWITSLATFKGQFFLCFFHCTGAGCSSENGALLRSLQDLGQSAKLF